MVAEGFAGETLTNTATAAVLEHQEDDPSNNSGSATVVAIGPSLVGLWRATSVLQNGVELLVGTSTQFIINLMGDGTFLESVAGDTQELFCDEETSCTDDGTWYVMGTRFFICDPGCDDEDLQYTISGNTLTVVVVDEDPVTTIVFVRLPEVIGTTELLPGDLCSDHPASAIATFEDTNLDAAIRVALALGPLDDLTCSRISWLTAMDAYSLGIVSLVGIQNLTSLTFLGLRFNTISDLGAVSELTSLTLLFLPSNLISDVSVLSGLTSLTFLRLQFNAGLTDIQPLLDNTGLGAGNTVDLRGTSVSCTDVAALQAKGVFVFSDPC